MGTPTDDRHGRRFLVIGLDGASFNVIQQWLDAGLLPNFQALVVEGASGELESCLPPVTMPAWRVFTTGKYPAKLGVFWHQQLDPQTLAVLTPNATYFKSADFWHYLNRSGLRTGVLGIPDTYPPRPLEGYLVAAGPSAGDHGYTYPPSLEGELERATGYQPNFKSDLYSEDTHSAEVEQMLAHIERTFEAADFLLEREDLPFLQVASYDINRMQHFFYDAEPTLRAWQIADRWLGRVRTRFDYVMVMSDHGTERVRRAFFLNVWLRQNGYLATRSRLADILPRLGINRTSAGRVLTRLGINRLFSFETLRKYGALLPTAAGGFGEFGSAALAQRVDWSRTRVIALPQGPIYINRRLVTDDAEYEALRSELIGRLETLRDPDFGEPIFKKVFRREEIYSGPYLDKAPHLLALSQDWCHNRAGLQQPEAFARSWRWKGNNRQWGLFMLAGPGVQAGRAAGVRIVDLAPTILHLCGVPVPEDMDGRVLSEVLKAEEATPAPQYQEGLPAAEAGQQEDDFDAVVRSRLENLGYL